jgi:putative modified peptide
MSSYLPETVVDLLLEGLANDDQFRDSFQQDPRGVLASLGFGPAADLTVKAGIWDCWFIARLASKAEIAAAHQVLRKQLLAEFPSYNPIGLGVSANRSVA